MIFLWIPELTSPDYGYATTAYSTTGGAGGGGFMPGSQTDSPSTKRSYGKDTLRPVTIKQLLNAHHPHPDAEHFNIDNAETTQVTFVGQVRNISRQTTNVTYKLDDGTGIVEVKEWVDSEASRAFDGPDKKDKVGEQAYVRVWGRLKAFNGKRHVGANFVRPIKDFNEIQYHLLEATAVHLQIGRGPLQDLQASGGANGGATGAGQNTTGDSAAGKAPSKVPAGASTAAKKVYSCLLNTTQTNEGLHMQNIATKTGMEIHDVMKGGEELGSLGLVYSTVDEHTWAILDL